MLAPAAELSFSDSMPRQRGSNGAVSSAFLGLALAFTIAACGDITGVAPDANRVPQASADAVIASGVTYYVSVSGNNSNAGTSPAQAWRTIGKVNEKTFAAGDRILFQGASVFSGTLSFTAADQGTAAAPIIVGSYGVGRAIINGGNGTALMLYNTSATRSGISRLSAQEEPQTTGDGISVYAISRAG